MCDEKETLLKKELKPTWENTGIWSKLFYWPAWGIVKAGSERDLELDDILPTLHENEAKELGEKLNAVLNSKEIQNSKNPLLCACVRIFGWKFLQLVFLAFFTTGILSTLEAVFLGVLIRDFSINAGPYPTLAHSCGLMFTFFIFMVSYQLYFFQASHLALKMKIAVSAVIYRKTLRVTQNVLRSTGVGQITNLLSSDVEILEYAMQYTTVILAIPISTIFLIYYIWRYVGVAVLGGISVLLLLVPFQAYALKTFGTLRARIAQRTDYRLGIINEVLNGILLIKMSTWEESFINRVKEARLSELKMLKKKAILNGSTTSLLQMITKIALFVTFSINIYQGIALNAESVFVTFLVFNLIGGVIAGILPLAIVSGAELVTSFSRVNEFLAAPEHETVIGPGTASIEAKLQLDSVSTRWSNESPEGLRNITFNLTSGKFLCVVGPVGSGKTMLLYAILREVELTSGSLKVEGSIAYTAQSPCLFSGTVRDNILFGNTFRPEWYEKVVDACALQRDFELLPCGDRTIVADKGSNLSGGQKSRISLARAIYQDADIYLLDDPLSSVDASVGSHIYENCICGLLKSKLVLLVTHLTQYCRLADEIIVLEGGAVKASGTYEYLLSLGHLSLQNQDAVDDVADTIESTIDVDPAEPAIKSCSPIPLLETMDTDHKMPERYTVDPVIFWKYLRFGNGKFIILLCFLLAIANQAILSTADFFLRGWTGSCGYNLEDDEYKFQSEYLLYYEILLIPMAIVPLLWSFTHYRVAFQTASKLHSTLFTAVIKAPIRFFEKNPVGTILNRFSKDTAVADDVLPQLLYMATISTLEGIGPLILVCYMTPVLTIPCVILLTIFIDMRKIYFKAASSVASLQTNSKSSLIGKLSDTLQGLITIRAYKQQGLFEAQFHHLQNVNSAATFSLVIGLRWFAITVQTLVFLFFDVVVVILIFGPSKDAAVLGLTLPLLLTISATLANMLSQTSDAQNNLVSIERILEFTKLQPEPLPHGEDASDSMPENSDWPTHGEITFNQACLSYNVGENVLDGINCHIRPMEKVGIIGRTGAGKTTLISTLFRLVELNSGSIQIDGIDISKIKLANLRSKIGIIPQDPMLFTGTLRRNLDPLQKYDDSEVWDALVDTMLSSRVSEFGLETAVTENGSNFSQGERQLICLARAILHKTKILVLDEATAHIDSKTDELIQNLVREKFKSCTVLTIAHRLGTILDSDRVCIMEAGKIVEFDPPKVLLADPSSRLSGFVKKTETTQNV